MNKTKDGRVIDKRVKISKNILNKILSEIKIKQKLNWGQLAKRIDISD